MSTSNSPQYYAELTGHTLHLVRASGAKIEFCRSCAFEQKATLSEMLAAWSGGTPVPAMVATTPEATRWHLSSREEAAKHRTTEALQTLAASLAPELQGAVEFVACNAKDGLPIAASGTARWLLGATSQNAAAAALAVASEHKMKVAQSWSATLVRVGAVASALRAAGGGQVLIWDIANDGSHAILVGPDGVEAVTPCATGFDAIFGVVQRTLALKFRGAAARLFFNDTYDFSEAAPSIVGEIAPDLGAALSMIAGKTGTTFTCIGLSAKQDWFINEIGRRIGLTPWTPDLRAAISALKLQVSSEIQATISPDVLGVLRLAALDAHATKEWTAAWVRGKAAATESTPAVLEFAAARPVVERQEGTAVAVSASKTAAAQTVGAEPKMRMAIAAKKAAPEPTVVLLSEATPTSTIAKAAAKNGARSESRAKGKANGSTPVATATLTASDRVVLSTPPFPVPATRETPQTKRRRPNFLVWGGVALGLVFVAVAGKFYFDAEAAKAAAAREKAAAAEQSRLAEVHAKALEQQAKAEQERIRREAEVARETAVARAKEQAEEQARVRITAAVEAERTAHSPGILIVTTSPAAAEVSIDGGAKRQAPLSINDIMPGTHRVVISRDGYDPVELTAEVKGAQTTDLGLIRLERTTGTLAIGSAPLGVEFTVRAANGGANAPAIWTGRTPAQFDDIPPGDYLVTYTREGWHDQIEKITVAKQAAVEATTRFVGGGVFISSTPSGAMVKRGGVPLGTTPLTLTNVLPDKVSYELSMAGHDPVTLVAEVTHGAQVRLAGELSSVDRLARNGEMATPPKPIETPSPRVAWDESAELNISFIVKRDGTVRDVQTVGKVDKTLAKLCVEAVSKWKFRPALDRAGQPLNVRVAQPIKFVSDLTSN